MSSAPRLLLAYVSLWGHSRRVAERMAEAVGGRALPTVADIAADAGHDPAPYAGVVVVGAVHRGRHPAPLLRWVRQHRARLAAVPSIFVSVSLNRAIGDPARRSGDPRDEAERFCRDAGWTPSDVALVGGGLPYTRYDVITRMVMRWLSGRAALDTDTARDHDYTDWGDVVAVARAFADGVAAGAASSPPA